MLAAPSAGPGPHLLVVRSARAYLIGLFRQGYRFRSPYVNGSRRQAWSIGYLFMRTVKPPVRLRLKTGVSLIQRPIGHDNGAGLE